MGYAASRDEIVGSINGVLDGEWTVHETRHGKDISIVSSWRLMIVDILEEYRQQGWDVVRKVQLSSDRARRDYINFQNPLWMSNPARARGTAVTKPTISP